MDCHRPDVHTQAPSSETKAFFPALSCCGQLRRNGVDVLGNAVSQGKHFCQLNQGRVFLSHTGGLAIEVI